MNIIFSFFCLLIISLSFHSNSACEDRKPSPLGRIVLSSVDLNIEGPLKDRLAKVSLEDAKEYTNKRRKKALQSAPKRRSPLPEEEGSL